MSNERKEKNARKVCKLSGESVFFFSAKTVVGLGLAIAHVFVIYRILLDQGNDFNEGYVLGFNDGKCVAMQQDNKMALCQTTFSDSKRPKSFYTQPLPTSILVSPLFLLTLLVAFYGLYKFNPDMSSQKYKNQVTQPDEIFDEDLNELELRSEV